MKKRKMINLSKKRKVIKLKKNRKGIKLKKTKQRMISKDLLFIILSMLLHKVTLLNMKKLKKIWKSKINEKSK